MLRVLVDTSVWIDYFRGGDGSGALDQLIDDGLVLTNELVLAELVPHLRLRRQRKVIRLLETVNKVPMQIDWPGIGDMQFRCLRSGANGVGIPDLIIAQNAMTNNCAVYSLDKHFRIMNKMFRLQLFA